MTVYTPDSPLRHPLTLWREMWRDLFAARGLAWRLFVRDLSALYRQSVLGYVWAFLPPLAATLTFTFLGSQNIIHIADIPVPYPAFVMMGTLLWQTFLDALNSPLKAVTNSRNLLAKINFPREALILAGVADVLFNFLVRLVLLIGVFLIYKLPVTPSLLLVPFGIFGLISLGLTLGMLLTPLGVLYTDVSRGVLLVGGFWMLLTPVVYPIPKTGLGARISHLNPVSPVLQTCRDWLSAQPATHLEGFLVVTGLSIVALLFGWVIYRLTMPILIERIGS